MADETLRISLQADLRDLTKSLQTLPGISDKEAKAMVAGLNRELGKAERAARKAASESEKAWKSAGQGMKTALSQVGGVAGQVGGIMFELGEKVVAAGSGVGALGAIAAGAVVGVAALGVAAKGIAESAAAATLRLDEMGLASVLPEKSVDAVREYHDAAADLARQLDIVTAKLGGPVIGALTDVSRAMVGAIDVADRMGSILSGPVASGIGILTEATIRMSPAGAQMISTFEAAADVFGLLRDRGVDVSAQLDEVARSSSTVSMSMQQMYDLLGMGETIVQPVLVKARKSYKEVAGAAAEVNSQVRLGLPPLRDLTDEYEALNNGSRSVTESFDLVADGIVVVAAEVDEANAKTKTFRDSWSEAGEAVQQAGEAIGEALSSEVMGAINGVFEGIMDLNDIANDQLEEQADRQVERATEIAEIRAQNQTDEIDRLVQIGAISEKEAQAERKRIAQQLADRRKAAQQLAKDEQKAARKNFKVNQGIQIAQAAMEGLRAAVSLIPAFSFAGPFAPVLAAGVAAPATALQIAAIKKQEPPEFPTGGMVKGGPSPDHTMIAAQTGEGILSRRGVAAAGGEQAVQSLNSGLPQSPQTIQVVLGRRVLAEAVADVMGRATLDPRRGRVDPQGGG